MFIDPGHPTLCRVKLKPFRLTNETLLYQTELVFRQVLPQVGRWPHAQPAHRPLTGCVHGSSVPVKRLLLVPLKCLLLWQTYSSFKTHLRCQLFDLDIGRASFRRHPLRMRCSGDTQEELGWSPNVASTPGPLLLSTRSISHPYPTLEQVCVT